ncbi:unnamed protein product [Cunninghamella blakesleeana]
MFPEPLNTTSFPFFEGTTYSQQVISINWNPINNLCIIIYQDNTLALCRSDLSLIWTIDDLTSNVICITWHPNGQLFAVGHEDGTVYQYDISHYTPEPTQCWPLDDNSENRSPPSITSLKWVDYTLEQPKINIPEFDPNAFDMETYLPPLSMAPLMDSFYPLPERPKKLPKKPRNTKANKSLLLIGDQYGCLHFVIDGSYHIGSVNCIDDSSKIGAIVDISITCNLDIIYIIIKYNNDVERLNDFDFLILNCNILQLKKRQIHNISSIQYEINYILQYIKLCANVLFSHYTTIEKISKSNIDSMSRIIKEHNDKAIPCPEIELLGILAAGPCSEALYDYFTNVLTQQKEKAWETNINRSYTSIQRIILEYLQPACERLLLQLEKLCGYGKCSKIYGEFLCKDTINITIQHVSKYMFTLQQLIISIGKTSKGFQEFFSWIHKYVQKLRDSESTEYTNNPNEPPYNDARTITNFLLNDFKADSLAAYFKKNTDIVSPLSSSLLSGNRKENHHHHQLNPTSILPDLLKKIDECCHLVLKRPSFALSYSTKLVSLFKICKGVPCLLHEMKGRTLASYILESDDSVHQYYAFIDDSNRSDNGSQIIIIHHQRNKISNLGNTNSHDKRLLLLPTTTTTLTQPSSKSSKSFLSSNLAQPKNNNNNNSNSNNNNNNINNKINPNTQKAKTEFSIIQIGYKWKITDMEFMDDKEIGLIVQHRHDPMLQSFLCSIVYKQLNYLPFHQHHGNDNNDVNIYQSLSNQLQPIEQMISRYMENVNMVNVIFGTNGKEKRRIMAIAASNGKYQVLEMDSRDEEEDDDDNDDNDNDDDDDDDDEN